MEGVVVGMNILRKNVQARRPQSLEFLLDGAQPLVVNVLAGYHDDMIGQRPGDTIRKWFRGLT